MVWQKTSFIDNTIYLLSMSNNQYLVQPDFTHCDVTPFSPGIILQAWYECTVVSSRVYLHAYTRITNSLTDRATFCPINASISKCSLSSSLSVHFSTSALLLWHPVNTVRHHLPCRPVVIVTIGTVSEPLRPNETKLRATGGEYSKTRHPQRVQQIKAENCEDLHYILFIVDSLWSCAI